MVDEPENTNREGAPADERKPGREKAADLSRAETDPSLRRSVGDDAPTPNIKGYEIIARIGVGGMGVVYKARQVRLNRIVALKMIISGLYASDDMKARFAREAKTVARMRHPDIVQVYDYGESEGRSFFSMELVDGGDLREWVQQPRPASEIAAEMETVARAVDYAHGHGVIHRDLKPGNILLTEEGSPKVSDFGLAKLTTTETALPDSSTSSLGMTNPGDIVGTALYMPPEQASGVTKRLGPAADVYALGAILYELLTGRPPFVGDTSFEVVVQVLSAEPVPPRRIRSEIPRDLETIILQCLEKDARRRYPSAADLADDLARWRRREPIAARRQSLAYWCWRRVVRRRRVLFVAAVVLLMSGCSWYWAVFIRVDPHRALREEEIAQAYERTTRSAPSAVETPHPTRTYVPRLPEFDDRAFEPVSRYHLWDLRAWRPLPPEAGESPGSAVVLTRRQRLRKLKPIDTFRYQMRTSGFDVFSRCLSHREGFRVLATDTSSTVAGVPMKTRQLVLDVADVPVDGEFNVESTHTYWNAFQDEDDWWLGAIVRTPTLKISFLVIPPPERPFQGYRLRVADLDGEQLRPYDSEQLVIEDPQGRYLFWECVKPRPGCVYRIDWEW